MLALVSRRSSGTSKPGLEPVAANDQPPDPDAEHRRTSPSPRLPQPDRMTKPSTVRPWPAEPSGCAVGDDERHDTSRIPSGSIGVSEVTT